MTKTTTARYNCAQSVLQRATDLLSAQEVRQAMSMRLPGIKQHVANRILRMLAADGKAERVEREYVGPSRVVVHDIRWRAPK